MNAWHAKAERLNMDKIVDLGEYKNKKPEVVWQCNCGCQLFYLMHGNNGELKCRDCNKSIFVYVEEDEE